MARGRERAEGLEQHRHRIRECQQEMAEVDFILRGSVVRRYMECGTKGCRCHEDPESLHGPYYDWTRKVAGKTVSVRLKEEEAAVVREWIRNGKRVDRLVGRMKQISLRALEEIRG